MSIQKIIDSIKEAYAKKLDYLILTDKTTEKFVQYAFLYDEENEGFWLDVPFQECTEEEKNKVSSILPERAYTGNNVEDAAGKNYLISEVSEAANVSDKIFREVFCTQSDYQLDVEMF